MNIPAEFDEIRPYTPEELPQVFEELLSDSSFQAVMAKIMPGVPQEVLAAQLKQCKTNLDVQKNFFYKLLLSVSIAMGSIWIRRLFLISSVAIRSSRITVTLCSTRDSFLWD